MELPRVGREQEILSGLAYVHVYTAAHGGGEIRGQIVPAAGDATLFVSMSGANETPPNGSLARGVGFCSMDLATSTAHYQANSGSGGARAGTRGGGAVASAVSGAT